MCPERLVSNVLGFNIDTMALLEKSKFSTQSADDAMKGALRYLEKYGFSSSPPDKLYRYRSPKHMVDEITNRYVYYSLATTMSDPYDCLFSSRRVLKKIGLCMTIMMRSFMIKISRV